MFDVPQTIIKVMIVLHSYPLVFSFDVSGAHGGFANGQRIRFSLGKYGHHCPLLTGSHPGVGVGETRAHDVGPGQDELDGSLVHHLGREQEGELVEQSQGGDPGLIVVPAMENPTDIVLNGQDYKPPEEKISSRVD